MKKVTLDSLVIIPENVVYSAWVEGGMDANSGFAVVLEAAEAYYEANMTPFFIFDKDALEIYCFAEETFGKQLH